MKNIKLFENFQSKEEIAEICEKYKIKNWSINSDGSIDVDSDVLITNTKLTELPLKFNKVKGFFYICMNRNLTTLKGCPKIVGGDFYCDRTIITSLEYGPSEVGGSYACYDCKLTDLKHCAIKIGKTLIFNNNNIKSLEGIGYVGNGISCDNNPIEKVFNIAFKYRIPTDIIELFMDYSPIRKIGNEYLIDKEILEMWLDDLGYERNYNYNNYYDELSKYYKII